MAKAFELSRSEDNRRQSENRVNNRVTTDSDSNSNSNRSQSENCSLNSELNAINANLNSIYSSITTMPTIRSQPSLDETEAVARELFTQFTRDQFTNEGLTQSEIEEQFQQLKY
jgi:hypothetical protein